MNSVAGNTDSKRLFVMAGYRAAGKTSVLKLAETREDFPIFRPQAMNDFKGIARQNAHLGNSGFHTFRHFRRGPVTHHGNMGFHYDFMNPLQDMTSKLFARRYSSQGLAMQTPNLLTKLIQEQMADGSFEACMRSQSLQLTRLATAFDMFEFSVIQSDWETNRQDWIARAERETGKSIEELSLLEKLSFNIALFAHDPEVGETLYNYVHTCWHKILRESGHSILRIRRTGTDYTAVWHDFSTQNAKG